MTKSAGTFKVPVAIDPKGAAGHQITSPAGIEPGQTRPTAVGFVHTDGTIAHVNQQSGQALQATPTDVLVDRGGDPRVPGLIRNRPCRLPRVLQSRCRRLPEDLAAVVRDAVTTKNIASTALVQALEPAAERFGSPGGNALLAALLKAAGYRPDTRVVELVTPELQEEFLRAVAPQLQKAVSQAVAEQFRQLAPKVDLSAVTQQLAKAAQKRETRDAARRQNRKADDGATADSAGSEPPETVPGNQAGQRGQKPRRRG